ncbi:hypothetical protein [Phycicoccus flavus]|uniref:hypothetical protein n=1 Tax=Phycicoccus flavus TaxID=2502783 RepID=UPI000FEBFB2E|nr:hypothetical protein [Phycicoccus flavus]NHA68138.1 hypothetical protein [Phycicoccus flavus]
MGWLGWGLAVAVVAAVVARVLMRVVALVELGRPAFSVSGTAGIVLLFALAGVGGAAVGRLGWRGGRRWAALAVSSGLLLYSGVAIGVSSLQDAAARDVPAWRLAVAGVLFVLVMGIAVATPWLALRLGRRSRVVP